jgi:hypothetical protein
MSMVNELRSSGAFGFKFYWRAYLVAIAFGFIAWDTGKSFLSVYLGLLAVVFVLHDRSNRRTDAQIDLILRALKERERKEGHVPTSTS